jgi:hypothetical protein
VPQEEGVEPGLGGLEVPDRLGARPGEITDGVIVDLGARDRCEVTCAHQSGPWHGLASIRVDLIPGLLRAEGGGDHPAVVTLLA